VRPGLGFDASGRWFDEVELGECFSRSITITETHLVLGAGLIGDTNPHHVDEEYAKRSRFGTRILHGMITSALMGAPVGMYFHGTAIAYLEHAARFTAPVRAGDTLTTTWTIRKKHPKPKHRGGVVALAGECRNQEGVVVAQAQAKMLVAARAREQGPRAGSSRGDATGASSGAS
jgi:3-hydroxybutyryl-CoA dehydratase